MSKRIRHLIINFCAINHRLAYLRLKGKHYNFSLFSVHAPIEVAGEEEKDEFYDELEQTYMKCPNHDVKIILGDMNAKIGREENHRTTIGEHSLHEVLNNNGLRLIQLTAALNMVVGSTLFPKKSIHKVTRVSPDGRTCNQIDHILVEDCHRTKLSRPRWSSGYHTCLWIRGSRVRSRLGSMDFFRA